MTQRPVDPVVSNYPLPMSARRARFEARRAKRNRLMLPKGHPFSGVPTWFPYSLARLLNAWRNRRVTG